MTSRQALRVLLIDDDDVDREAVQRGFDAVGAGQCLTVARDGIEALALLRGIGHGPAKVRPHIVLLDLNMPRMGGFEFLRELRNDAATADAIVFVFTTSDSVADKSRAFTFNVAGYFSKSRIGTDWAAVARMVQDYWALNGFPSASTVPDRPDAVKA